MRKNIEKVLHAWLGRYEAQGDSKRTCWTDGHSIYSYDTCILTRAHGKIVLNNTGYSRTTTSQQRAISLFLEQNQLEFVVVGGVPRGCTSEQLAVRFHSDYQTIKAADGNQ